MEKGQKYGESTSQCVNQYRSDSAIEGEMILSEFSLNHALLWSIRHRNVQQRITLIYHGHVIQANNVAADWGL